MSEQHTTRKLKFSQTDLSIEPGVEHKFSFELTRNDVAGNAILDVGCWNGKYLNLIKELNPRLLVGLDIEIKALRIGKKAVCSSEFVRSSVFCLPFKDNAFDMATLWGVIEHLPAYIESRAPKEINRVLKKGGKFFMMTAYDHFLSNILDPALLLVGHRHSNEVKLADLLRSSNFVTTDILLKGGLFYSFQALLFYLFKHILRRNYQLKTLTKKVEEEFNEKGKGFSLIYVIARKRR